MATRKKSALEEERMTDTNIVKVIQMLEDPGEGVKPWTKKECCSFLGMAYNTTRLGTIIETFKAKKAREAERRAALRGKAVTPDEVIFIIQEYLAGEPVDNISQSTFRSPSLIKRVLEDTGTPIRVPGSNYFSPALIPEESMRDRFSLGEVVYSARYDSLARVDYEIQDKSGFGWVYRIWLLAEKWQQNAYQPAHELASLEHLRKLGVKV